MTLRERLDNDLKSAMKSRESLRVSVLRMLRSEIRYKEIERGESLTDDDIAQVVAKESKKRQESVEQYEKAGRTELAEKEAAEKKILFEYLPVQMDEAAIAGIVREVISELQARSKADKGKVMGALMPKVRGKADGAMVNRIVDQLLEGNSA
jgi:uncharacterized protein